MDDDFDQVLTHVHHVKLDDICSNLCGAWIYTTAYFESEALNCATVDELVQAVSKAHAYLDVHMDMLSLFKLVDSSYGLALCSLIYCITCRIPAAQRVRAWKVWELSGSEHLWNTYDFRETLCIPGDPGYAPDDDSSVGEADLCPFCLAVMPLPIKPAAVPSSSKSVDVPVPSASSKKVSKPKMIHTPQAPREPSFASPTKKQISVVLPPKNAKSSPPMTRKCLHAPEPVKTTPVLKVDKAPPAKPIAPKQAVQMRATTKKKVPMPTKPKPAVKKPILVDSSSDSEVKHESDGEEDAVEGSHGEAPEGEGWLSDKIEVPPVKKPHLAHVEGSNPLPPHAYHPLTGLPLPGLLYVPFTAPTDPAPPLPVTEPPSKSKGKGKATEPSSPTSPSLCGCAVRNKRSPPCSSKDCRKARKSPVTSGSKAGDAATPTLEADNRIYVRAFHPQINLQFHEPLSRQALESMKLSMLPSAPNSLTKAPTQVRNGQEYVYRCHSDIDPHFICPLLLTWPCYNCTLFRYPDECEFEGEVGEEVCTRCKTGHHGPCSAHWDANQLRRAATLLDPLTLSSDSAICHGVDRVKCINAEIALLGRAMHCLHEDHEKIIGKLADGLDAISSREHGTEIIDAYTQISDFLKSLVIRLGEDVEDSDAEGRASEAGAT
ncbi:hypothetical protein ARMGADRAFT_1075792 [Armillaria gallica]|uniref:Uncharacterized protein n=1 Tax=Armillaria gallica TaxID=47427 RepID=A0A2H3DT89_ARMGA|nr:hypothetical protein ARMGADRAFT_1075792 [Armillaria gallica]